MTEYPSCFEAVLSGFSDPGILSSCLAHVHPQWNDISDSPLPQNNDKQSEYPSKIDEHKMFDEMSHTTVSSEINEIHTIIHEGENFATTIAKVGDDSFSEDLSLQIKVPTVVLVDIKESNTEEDNPQDNVILFDKSTKWDTSDSLVPFPSQGIVMSNASMHSTAIEYPFDGVLWHHTIPCFYNFLEDMCWGEQSRMSPYLDFSLHKCNGYDTGQEHLRFLMCKLRELSREEKIQGLLEAFAARYSERVSNILFNKDNVLLFAIFGVVHISKATLSYLVFDLGPYLDYEISALLLGKVVGIFCQRLYLDDEFALQRTDQQLASPYQAPRTIQHCYIDSIFVESKFLQARSILQLVWILLLAENKLRPSVITEYACGILVKELHCYDAKVEISKIIVSSIFLYKIWERLMGNQLMVAQR